MKNKDECIDLIKRLNELDEIQQADIEEVLKLIEPFLLRKYGRNLYIQVEKLCKARNFDRAVKLLVSLPKRDLFRIAKGKYMSLMIAVIAVIGAIAVVFTNDRTENTEAVDSWYTTDAVIIKSRVGSQIKGSTSIDIPDIEFSYQVDGVTYTADSVYYTEFDDPVDIVAQFPEGKETTVSYNSNDPQEAYLTAESKITVYFFVATVVISIIVFLFFYRKRKRSIFS